MPDSIQVDYENFVVDAMLQTRKHHAVATLFIDCERDAISAVKCMMLRAGIDIDVAYASEAEKRSLQLRIQTLKDINYAPIEHAASSLLKLKRNTSGPIAVYARVSMRDPHTAEFLKVASAADHLVIVAV